MVAVMPTLPTLVKSADTVVAGEAPRSWPEWLQARARAAGAAAVFPTLAALYVHVPFCAQICAYCDFARELSRGDRIEAWLEGIAREVELTVPAGFAPDTVFYGGGTPSVLTPVQWDRLRQALGRRVDFSRAREITIECNPGTLDGEKLVAWQRSGVNRISFGAQSFDPAMLKTLGRIHNVNEIGAGVEQARAAGLTDCSVDLIYGLPGQSAADFERSLDAAAALPITHLSAYALTYEPGTPFHVLREQGRLAVCDEDTVGAMYRLAMARLREAGFLQYEISNYSRGAGHAAVHNLVYWHRGACHAVGPSAAGFIGGRRTTNERDLSRWLQRLAGGEAPVAGEETVDAATAAAEAFVLRLRLNEGVDLPEFVREYGVDPTGGLEDKLALWQKLGLVQSEPGRRLQLTDAGRPVADGMLCEFIPC